MQSPTHWRPHRRELLQVGTLAGLGLSLPVLLAKRAMAEQVGPVSGAAKSCILVWLDGGPSHIDTFDPKPDAAQEVRGPFSTLATTIPGIRLSELLPELARRMKQISIVRSVTSPLGEHNLGAQYMLTGYQPSPVIDYPPVVSVLSSRLDKKEVSTLPRSVAIPNFRVGGGGVSGHGFLSADAAPFSVEADPSDAGFNVRNLTIPGNLSSTRLARRQAFREWLKGRVDDDPLTQKAFSILGSGAAQDAFDLKQESELVRHRYGGKTIGQSCLLARRLVEAGVPLVTLVQQGWDTHADLITRLRDGYTGAKVPVGLGPSLDQALSSLIDDLIDRGLYDETCVVVMGEFGRTPKWNPAGGRDHWPRVFSVMFGGGPFKRGLIYGASDRQGESPQDYAVTPADLAHTIYRALGVDSLGTLATPDGRTIRLASETGSVIQDLLANG